ncbi:hypothetical protein [Singulisphaera sp. PoT]|uniref:hypothetical protein n=1 Tax=Singulisphaera sp. PoT TaxID=3411797 RepID=UPI003BF5F399
MTLPSTRPLWVMLEGNKPRLASECKASDMENAVYWCREGDERWETMTDTARQTMGEMLPKKQKKSA